MLKKSRSGWETFSTFPLNLAMKIIAFEQICFPPSRSKVVRKTHLTL